MTETRQKIIELIEPYMNKELTFGCLIFWEKPEKLDYIIDEIKPGLYKTNLGYLDTELNKGQYTVIGHYDITAVMNFIHEKTRYHKDFIFNLIRSDFDKIKGEWSYISVSDYTNFDDEGKVLQYKIPNKPLYLYTQREDEKLLEMLLEIKND